MGDHGYCGSQLTITGCWRKKITNKLYFKLILNYPFLLCYIFLLVNENECASLRLRKTEAFVLKVESGAR